MSGNNHDIMKEFYQLSQKVLEEKPWQFYDDGQLIALVSNRPDEPVYVNILGNAGKTYGIVFYDGYDGLNDYNLLRHSEDLDLPPQYALFRQTAYAIYFGEEDEVPEEQLDYYHDLPFDFSQTEFGIPFVISMRPGFFPWSPRESEIADVNSYLRDFFEVYERMDHNDQNWGVGSYRGFCQAMKKKDSSWQISYPPLLSEEYLPEELEYHEEYLEEELKGAKKNDSAYELDVYIPNIHIDDPMFYRPAAMTMILVADSQTGMVLGQYMMEPAEELIEKMNDTLLGVMKQYGIPETVFVRSPVFAQMIVHLCEQTGCVPEVGSLDAMNEAIWEGSGRQLRIEAPFVNMNKADVVKIGLELGVPYELTWSCYEGGEKPCGKCGTCIDRAAAFAANGVEDPAIRMHK